jgi:O-antigen/teichoic acid export membrane protein
MCKLKFINDPNRKRLSERRRSFYRRIRMGSAVLLDQGFYSAANFILTVALARLLDPQTFGIFASVQICGFLMIGLFTGLITDPLTVSITSVFVRQHSSYVRRLSLLQLAAGLLISIASFPVLIILVRDAPPVSFGFLAAATLFTAAGMGIWYVRRLAYAVQRPALAANVAILYSLSCIVVISTLHFTRLLTVTTAMACVGTLAALCSAFGLTMILRELPPTADTASATLTYGQVAREHWRLGSFLVLTYFFHYISQQTPAIMLSQFHGLEEIGAFRLLTTLLLPVLVLLPSVMALQLPKAAAYLHKQQYREGYRVAFLTTALCLALAIPFSLVIAVFNEELVHLAFGNTYDQYAGLLPIMALIPLLNAVTMAPNMVIRAARWRACGPVTTSMTVLVACAAAFTWIPQYGLAGAVWSIITVHVTAFLVISAAFVWWHQILRPTFLAESTNDLARVQRLS